MTEQELLAENKALWELADTAVLAALSLDRQVGCELIRLRTRLGLNNLGGRRDSQQEAS